jgi:hypothetical protein
VRIIEMRFLFTYVNFVYYTENSPHDDLIGHEVLKSHFILWSQISFFCSYIFSNRLRFLGKDWITKTSRKSGTWSYIHHKFFHLGSGSIVSHDQGYRFIFYYNYSSLWIRSSLNKIENFSLRIKHKVSILFRELRIQSEE